MADPASPLKDVVYIAIGFGVLGIQKAQVVRVDIANHLKVERAKVKAQLEDAKAILDSQKEATGDAGSGEASKTRGQLQALVQELDAKLAPVGKELETRIDQIVERLPEQVQDAVVQARHHARGAAHQLRSIVGIPAA